MNEAVSRTDQHSQGQRARSVGHVTGTSGPGDRPHSQGSPKPSPCGSSVPLRSAVRSPGPSLALACHPWGCRPLNPVRPPRLISPEACDMGSEPLAWLLCGRADTSRCSATEPGSRLSPRGGGGAWLSGDRPAGCRRTLMTTWQGLPLGTPDCKGSAAGEKGPRALELGDLDSGPSCTGALAKPWSF